MQATPTLRGHSSPSPPKTLLGRSTSDARLPRVAERSMVPHRQRARTPIISRDESLLPLTPDVPPTQTPLEYPDSDRGRCSSDPSRTPNTGYPTPSEARALQPPDRNPPNPQLQGNSSRDTRTQAYKHAAPSARNNRRNESQPLGNNQPFIQRKPTSTAHSTPTQTPECLQMVTDNLAVLRA